MRELFTRYNQVAAPRPNWSNPVLEALEYKTEIFMAEDGSESRHSHRTMPRITVDYVADALDDAAVRVFNDVRRVQNDHQFAVPVRWRSFELTADLLSPGSSITIPSAPWWVQPGLTLVLESETEQEAVFVETLGDDNGATVINFTTSVAGDYPAGSQVMLGLWSHYAQETGFLSIVRRHRGHQASFLASPGRLPQLAPPAASGPAYRGYEVIRERHNWAGRLEITVDDRRETVDFERGVIDRTWARTSKVLRSNWSFLGLDYVAVDEVTQIFMRHRGKRVPFWSRWPGLDMPQHQNASSGSRNLFFYGSEFSDEWGDDPHFNYLWVEWPDGAFQINRIDSLSSSAGDDLAICQDNWERPVDQDATVYWAVLSRFDTDRLDLEWITDEAAQAALPVRVLRTDWLDDFVTKASNKVEVRSSYVSDWATPATFTSIPLVESGVSEDLIDTGTVDLVIEWAGTSDGEEPNSWPTELQVAFFDGSGAFLSDIIFASTAFQIPSVPLTTQISREYGVPSGAREVRARIIYEHTLQTTVRNEMLIRAADWGRNNNGGNLKWF